MRLPMAPVLAAASLLTTVSLSLAQEQPTSPIPGAASLAGSLAGRQSYLFEEADRQELDQLNRRIRESEKQYRESPDPAEKSKAAAEHNAAAQSMFAILERHPALIRIDTTGDAPTMTPDAPVELAGDRGTMLLRIDGGEGPVGCFFRDYDLSFSNFSPRGRYLSMTLEVEVESDEVRNDLFASLGALPAVRIVL